ncbi:hypothetical protein M407DRAFT_29146 [Tulasnella calospora MUT 4182]|uniref:Uncharacterized protein n=1 Tax=Tulasnella calospora MUT 4182 TaxID=1051891 RepID=A0A0C3LIG4_9AGAM|nr:hypothetical protein M407DRAFT_29146 [Tulasnella calospora MUT 4182]
MSATPEKATSELQSSRQESALTGEYWNHVENFPCHQIFWADAEDELKGILGHGAIDDLTSPGSTCPWSAKECAEYTSIIEKFKACDHNDHVPYRVVSIARLWAMIARVRHINQYGLTSPRLDRLQGLFEYYQAQKKASFKIALGEVFCLGMSRSTFTRTDAILLATGHQSGTTMASASMAGASVLISLILHQAHSRERLATAPDISAYIMQVEGYFHGLRPLSITFTLPHALTAYSALMPQYSLLMIAIQNLTSLSDMISVASIWFLPALLALLLFASFGGRFAYILLALVLIKRAARLPCPPLLHPFLVGRSLPFNESKCEARRLVTTPFPNISRDSVQATFTE